MRSTSLMIKTILIITTLAVMIVPTYMILDSVTEVKSLQLGRLVDHDALPEYSEAKVDYADQKYIPVVRMIDTESGRGFCSGFIISNDYMISAAHCFIDPKTSRLKDVVYGIQSRSIDDENVVMNTFVQVVGVHVNADYAILKGDFKQFTKMRINASGSVLQQWTQRRLMPMMPEIPVFAVGYPMGTKDAMAYGQASCQIVYDYIECAQSAGLLPGMSGGPAIDPLTGEVIGINFAMGPVTKYFKHMIGIFDAFGVKGGQMSLLQVFNNLDSIKKQPIDNSPYFKWSEALYLKQVNAYAIPSIAQATEIMKLCKVLDAIRAHFNTPIIITSWLRPEAYNRLIGGATFSHHRTGSAVDFMVSGLSSDFVRAELKKHPEVTQGVSFETGIVHVHIQNDGKGLWFPPPATKHKGLMQND